jgi:hypothetical protein
MKKEIEQRREQREDFGFPGDCCEDNSFDMSMFYSDKFNAEADLQKKKRHHLEKS